jgi:hypothetical protein
LVTSKDDFGPSHGFPASGALLSRPAESCPDSLGDSDSFLLSDPGGNRHHQLSCWSGGAEVLFSETYELNPVRREPLDVLERLSDAFARQPIKSPN